MKKLKETILYQAKRFHAAFPSLAKFSDGNLLLAFRRARDGLWLLNDEQRAALDRVGRMDHIDSRSHILLLELDSMGEPLDQPADMLPIDPEAGDQDPSLLVLTDQELFVASFSWYPLPTSVGLHMKGCVPPGENVPGCRYLFWGAHTSLRGREPGSWNKHHRYVHPAGGFGHSVSPNQEKQIAGSCRGQALLMDNQILLPLYGEKHQEAVLFCSIDKGNSWQFHASIARDPEGKMAYQEPALCPDGNGGMVCFMRTAGADGRLATASTEDGLRWSAAKLHRLVGHPFHPLPLADGRVLLTYGYRVPPFGIRARLLEHARQDPDEVEEFVIRDDGQGPDVGYPWAVQLANGQVMVAYYLTSKEGIRYIAASWLELD